MRAREKRDALEWYRMTLWLLWEAGSPKTVCLVWCLQLKSRGHTSGWLETSWSAIWKALYLPIDPRCPVQFSYTPRHLEFTGCTNNRLQDVYQEYIFITFTKKTIAFKKIQQATSLSGTGEVWQAGNGESWWGAGGGEHGYLMVFLLELVAEVKKWIWWGGCLKDCRHPVSWEVTFQHSKSQLESDF